MPFFRVKLSYTGYVEFDRIQALTKEKALYWAEQLTQYIAFNVVDSLDSLERWPCADEVEEIEKEVINHG